MEFLPFEHLRSFLRNKEDLFYQNLAKLADARGLGVEYFQHPTSHRWTQVFTGAGLCLISSEILLQVLKAKYGFDARVRVVHTDDVLMKNHPSGKRKPHAWINVDTSDRGTIFIDPTHGQVNYRLNRIVIDQQYLQPGYFGYTIPPSDITAVCQENFQFKQNQSLELEKLPRYDQKPTRLYMQTYLNLRT